MAVLVNNEESTKSTLRIAMLGVDDLLVTDDHVKIREGIKAIKGQHKQYADVSRSLSRWFLSHGSLQQSTEIRHERYELHGEVDECIKALNSKLEGIGVDIESKFGDYSSVVSHKDGSILDDNVQTSENVVDDIISNIGSQNDSESTELNDRMQRLLADPTPEAYSVNEGNNLKQISAKINDCTSVSEIPVFSNCQQVSKAPPLQMYPMSNVTAIGQRDPIMSTSHIGQSIAQPVQSHSPNNFVQSCRLNHLPLPHSTESFSPNIGQVPNNFVPQAPIANFQYAQEGAYNETARQFLKMEIIKGLSDPFDGDCKKFWSWHDFINSRIIEAGLEGIHVLHALKANTKGRPQKLITDYIDAGINDPSRVVAEIWTTFRRRYGSNDQVSSSLRDQMRRVSKITSEYDIDAMEDLYGLSMVIGNNSSKCESLKYYLLPEGMKEIWEKMPISFIRKWQNFYCKKQEQGASPSFQELMSEIIKFINVRSNPMFKNVNMPVKNTKVLKTSVKTTTKDETKRKCCSIHDSITHTISSCDAFKSLTMEEKMKHAAEHKLCFRCLGYHRAKWCKSYAKCDICRGSHITVMHQERSVQSKENPITQRKNNTPSAQSLCTSVCKNSFESKVCSKTVPVELRLIGQGKSLKCLAIIDEQSNNTFIDENVVDLLKVPSSNIKRNKYVLTTLDQLKSTVDGSIVSGLEVKGIKKTDWIDLPPSFTHSGLPDTSGEAADPDLVRKHNHIRRFANKFSPIDSALQVMVLIGTNCGKAMQTRCYGNTFPYVHDTALGFALVGPSCLDIKRDVSEARVLRSAAQVCEHFSASPTFSNMKHCEPSSLTNVFIERSDDEFSGPSKEDEEFNGIVSAGIKFDYRNNIEIPLTFKQNIEHLLKILMNNRSAVYKRSFNTLSRIKKDEQKTVKCVEIMDKYLERGHVEELTEDNCSVANRNYIPVFLVINEKSLKGRLVFDSSAKYMGVSLNDCLLQGPDETNKLIGVLIRFRHEEVAVSADIECMFHSFYVPHDQRDYQCFFWWKGNNPNNGVTAFRANVHVFGHTSSPSIATYGLRYATKVGDAPKYKDACEFITENTYVDDGLRSESTVEQAISTLKNARKILATYNIRLHKIISTHSAVLQAFPPSEIAKDVDTVDLNQSMAQHALGITWNIDRDEFQLKCHLKKSGKFTRRTVLSINGSLFDPLGIASPVGLTGKLLQRQIFSTAVQSDSSKNEYWDEPLPEEHAREWASWITLLEDINLIKLPRCYHPSGFGEVQSNELHIFCDASKDSIGHVIYLRQIDVHEQISVSFVFASSKVSPRAATTIPRLELCAAVAAAMSAQYVHVELNKTIHLVQYYSDSNIVLGYLNNRVRRFSRYVTSRVQNILSLCSPNQWKYISTENNPADIATRAHTPKQLVGTSWLQGPDFLRSSTPIIEHYEEKDIELPETAKETRVLLSTKNEENYVLTCLSKFSKWKKICNVSMLIFVFISKLRRRVLSDDDLRRSAIHFIIREVQKSSFPEMYSNLSLSSKIPASCDLSPLNPFLDDDTLMRVGGRLQHGELSYQEKHPVLLPHKHPITLVILRHYHEKSMHQGRHITTSTMRQAGLHIHKPRSVISSLIKNCVTCKKLRGSFQCQQMSPLPADRLERTAPFEKVGMDVFGPYVIHDGRSTRRTKASKKVWVLLFTCLYSRAVHLECLVSLDTSTFIMAFRRFSAVRGRCRLIRSDHGTNFIGAKNELEGEIDVPGIMMGIKNEECVWELVPPYASHFAGVWERKVGSVKRVLNVAIAQAKQTFLSRDEFCTLLQEAGSIVNNTPLDEISCDPTEPFPVSPAKLLTLREDLSLKNEVYSEDDLLQYGKRRWRRCQFLADQFWQHWKRDYVSSLQDRNKWKFPERNMTEGDIVLVRSQVPRNQWPLAIIDKVHPGRDGLVRRVVVRLKSSERGTARFTERAIHDLILLIPSNVNAAT